MLILEAIILGIIQGLTEFIPVSSSGHLIAVPRLFGWKDMGLAFDVALHLGTLVAVVLYFRNDWLETIAGFVNNLKARRNKSIPVSQSGKLFVPLFVACVPAAVAGYLWDDVIENVLREWYWVAGSLILVAFVMLAAEKIGNKKRDTGQMNYVDYLTIGFAQALALFPGTSRSGITISAGLFRNLDRAAAARFSFMMSTPIILGAGMLKLKDVFESGLPTDQYLPFVLGFISAAISGYLAIRFLMNYLRDKGLAAFSIYRICFAIFMIAVFTLK